MDDENFLVITRTEDGIWMTAAGNKLLPMSKREAATLIHRQLEISKLPGTAPLSGLFLVQLPTDPLTEEQIVDLVATQDDPK